VWKTKKGKTFGLLLAIFGIAVASLFVATKSYAAINSQISFQGKVVKADNTNPTDGTYNMQFKIYSGGAGTTASPGTQVWFENRLIGGSGGVAVSAGTFQVNLGSVSTLSGVDFNSDNLWLSMQIGNSNTCTATATNFQTNCGGDGEMSPFIRFTATPYAMNADKIGGVALSGLVQLTPGSQQTGSINVSGSVTTASTIQAAGSITTGSTSAVGNLILQDGTANNYRLTLATQAMSSGSFTMVLPATGASGNQCLQSTSGSTWSNTSLYFAACASGGAVSLQTAYNNGTTITQTASGSLTLTMNTTAPTADQLVIDNTGSNGVTTAGVNGVSVKYKGGAAAVEAAGMRVDFTPGTTSGGTWSGMRIVEAAGPASGVTSYGLKLEGNTTGTGGISTAISVASGWDIGVDIQSGGIQLTAQNDPSTPGPNNLKIYAKDIAGRIMPKWIGPAGVDTQFQASLGFNRVAMAVPAAVANCTTGFTAFGTTLTTAGTCSIGAMASTNLLTSVRRTTISSGATAGTVAFQRQAALMAWRGNNTGLGGFFFTQRFGLSGTLQTDERAFVGLSNAAATPTNVSPILDTNFSKIGMGIAANTGNWKLIHNVAGTTPTTVDLTNAPINTTNLYELVLYSPPNGSYIGYRVTNLSNGTVISGSTTSSTNVPASNTFLAPITWITNNAQAAAAQIDHAGWYLESDN